MKVEGAGYLMCSACVEFANTGPGDMPQVWHAASCRCACHSATDDEYVPTEWDELAEKGWVNYHALAAAYDDPSHDRGPIEACRAETCKFFVGARRSLIRSADDAAHAKPVPPDLPCARCGHRGFDHALHGYCDASRGGVRLDNCEGFVYPGADDVTAATCEGDGHCTKPVWKDGKCRDCWHYHDGYSDGLHQAAASATHASLQHLEDYITGHPNPTLSGVLALIKREKATVSQPSEGAS